MKTLQAAHGELIIPISQNAAEAVENVGQILMAGELTPELLSPRERLFRTTILAINRHFTAMDDELLSRITELSAVKRPNKFWELVDLMVKSDNSRAGDYCQYCNQPVGPNTGICNHCLSRN